MHAARRDTVRFRTTYLVASLGCFYLEGGDYK